MVWHFTMLGNSLSQTAWAIIQLSKPRTKPRTLRHEARDEIFQAPSPFFGGGAWVRGYFGLRDETNGQMSSIHLLPVLPSLWSLLSKIYYGWFITCFLFFELFADLSFVLRIMRMDGVY